MDILMVDKLSDKYQPWPILLIYNHFTSMLNKSTKYNDKSTFQSYFLI